MANETVRPMTQGQWKDIIATMIGAVPDLSFDEANRVVGKKGALVADIREVFTRHLCHAIASRAEAQAAVPADDEEFELTLDGDAVDPIEMVRQSGFANPEAWKLLGPRVTEMHVRRFKLVRAGYCLGDLADVEQKAGKLAEGQWRETFRKKYPRPDGRGPIGFGGSEWMDPLGTHVFACLFGSGAERWRPFFDGTGGFNESWRWLVEVSK